MSHEITRTDSAAFSGKPAWHGLGTVVEELGTANEALTVCDLNWTVEQLPVYAEDGITGRIEIPSHRLNVRSDTKEVLGMVSDRYKVFNNQELADFVDSLAKENDRVQIETCGSLYGGKKVWFLLRGESFSVRSEDEVTPYILASNGHDGNSRLRLTPTGIRVVCKNTAELVVPISKKDEGRVRSAAFCCRHTGSLADKVEAAREALQLYEHAVKSTKEIMDRLAQKEIDSATLGKFFADNYVRDFGEIPTDPKNLKEQRKLNKANSAFDSFSRRWDDEAHLAGRTAWNAYNAYTGLIQHDMKARGKTDVARYENRANSNLFGLSSSRSMEAMQLACSI